MFCIPGRSQDYLDELGQHVRSPLRRKVHVTPDFAGFSTSQDKQALGKSLLVLVRVSGYEPPPQGPPVTSNQHGQIVLAC
jgi:hypothetical protein